MDSVAQKNGNSVVASFGNPHHGLWCTGSGKSVFASLAIPVTYIAAQQAAKVWLSLLAIPIMDLAAYNAAKVWLSLLAIPIMYLAGQNTGLREGCLAEDAAHERGPRGGRAGLVQELKESMQSHLRLHFANEEAADEAVLASYPTTIRRRLLRHLYLEQLRSCYLFQGCRQKFLDAVLSIAKVELFMPKVPLLPPPPLFRYLLLFLLLLSSL
jgi:hypothetical protein